MDAERARKNERTILQALAERGQKRVAEALGTSESTVSRLKEGELDKIAKLLAACGLKVVPEGKQCFDPEYIVALQTIAAEQLRNKSSGVVPLVWGD